MGHNHNYGVNLSDNMICSLNPRTGQMIRKFHPSSSSDIREVFKNANRIQKNWFSDTTKEDRANLIRELGQICHRNINDAVEIMHSETGIPRGALAAACKSALSGIDHYISEYLASDDRDYSSTQTTRLNDDIIIQFRPHGTVAHIGVWNFPFWQTLITAIPALLSGNAVVYKPSELSTMSGLKIAELIHEAGYPKELYAPLIGGAEVGKEMVRSSCDAIAFTGSIDTGREIVRNAGIKPLILELSGNDAAIVCEDADISQAASGIAYGSFSRGGQICIRVKRVYVHESVANEFIEELKNIASNLSVEEDIGPLIREEARQNVHRVVLDALRKGSELIYGGNLIKGPGFFYEPTVLKYHDDSLEVVRKETFGPVCPVREVRSEEEAITLANNSQYGLGATIWTRNIDRGHMLAEQMEVGNIWINDCIRTLPGGEYFQGWKQSSIPSSMSRLQMFMKKRTVVSNRSSELKKHWFQVR